MGEAPPDRAAVAHRPVGDAGGHAGHHAVGDIGDPAILDIRVGHAGADDERAAVPVDPPQLRHAGDVDDAVGLDQPEIEHRSERLAAGHDLGRPVRAGDHGERGGKVAGPLHGEARRLHEAAVLSEAVGRAARTASTMRRGVIGEWRSSTPSGLSASLTALAIAAGGAMAPPSPMPLAPNRV